MCDVRRCKHLIFIFTFVSKWKITRLSPILFIRKFIFIIKRSKWTAEHLKMPTSSLMAFYLWENLHSLFAQPNHREWCLHRIVVLYDVVNGKRRRQTFSSFFCSFSFKSTQFNFQFSVVNYRHLYIDNGFVSK